MKKVWWIILLITIISLQSCTNDEGDQDIDILTPDEKTQKED